MFRATSRRWAVLLLAMMLVAAPGVAVAEPLSPAERMKLQKQATDLTAQAVQLYRAGQPSEAVRLARQVLQIREQIYAIGDYPDGHADLASSLNYLGFFLIANDEHGKALPYYEKALAMRKRLYPPDKYREGRPDLATSLYNLRPPDVGPRTPAYSWLSCQ